MHPLPNNHFWTLQPPGSNPSKQIVVIENWEKRANTLISNLIGILSQLMHLWFKSEPGKIFPSKGHFNFYGILWGPGQTTEHILHFSNAMAGTDSPRCLMSHGKDENAPFFFFLQVWFSRPWLESDLWKSLTVVLTVIGCPKTRPMQTSVSTESKIARM